jgi:hypothetical protein
LEKRVEAQVRDFEGRVGWDGGVEGIQQKREGLISQEAKRHNFVEFCMDILCD